MQIREATANDYDALLRLLLQLYPGERGAFHPERVQQEHRSFVATIEGEVVGFLLGSFIEYGLSSEGGGMIEQLVVDEAHRGQGIGEQLVEDGSAGFNLKASALALSQPQSNWARRASYEQCGFRLCVGPWLVWSVLRQ
jgi:predicted N-acetyltransferase YhbS